MKNFFSIGIAGLGNVGSATVSLIKQNNSLISKNAGTPIKIVAVSARNKFAKRNIKIEDFDWEENATALAYRDDIDAVVELIGGEGGVAKELIMSSLNNGKHVITANKALLAKHGNEIKDLVLKKKVGIYYEAAVAAAIPIINAINFGISSNQINRIQAILNGTCNFVLSEMKSNNSSFDSALQKAKDFGFAEVDSSFDIDGIDSSQKLSILGMLAYSAIPEVEKIYTEGIKNISKIDMYYSEKLGYSVKLFCIANLQGKSLDFRVHPALIAEDTIASHVSGALNSVFIEGDFCNRLTFIGEGAGPNPTASSVVSDIINSARNRTQTNYSLFSEMKKYNYISIDDRVGAYYIRFLVKDIRGVISNITSILNENSISLDSIVQDSKNKKKSKVNIVVITHETKEKNINKAIELVNKLESVLEQPRVIRVEKI